MGKSSHKRCSIFHGEAVPFIWGISYRKTFMGLRTHTMGVCMAWRLLMETHGANCAAYGINGETIYPPLFVSLHAFFARHEPCQFSIPTKWCCLLPSASFLRVYRVVGSIGRSIRACFVDVELNKAHGEAARVLWSARVKHQ